MEKMKNQETFYSNLAKPGDINFILLQSRGQEISPPPSQKALRGASGVLLKNNPEVTLYLPYVGTSLKEAL